MKTVFEHIEHVKGQPHHIRKSIAFVSATVGAGLIALVWLVGSVANGLFAVQGSSFADATGGAEAVDVTNNSQGIAGVAAVLDNEDAPAHIEIVDTTAGKAPVKKPEQTTIPF